MIVKINVPQKRIKLILPIPLSLFFNRLTCPLMAYFATKYTEDLYIDSNQLYELFKCLKESKKEFGHYNLVNVQSRDGMFIEIRI